MDRLKMNGANAVKAQWIDNSSAQKENGKKYATRDVKPGKVAMAEL